MLALLKYSRYSEIKLILSPRTQKIWQLRELKEIQKYASNAVITERGKSEGCMREMLVEIFPGEGAVWADFEGRVGSYWIDSRKGFHYNDKNGSKET